VTVKSLRTGGLEQAPGNVTLNPRGASCATLDSVEALAQLYCMLKSLTFLSFKTYFRLGIRHINIFKQNLWSLHALHKDEQTPCSKEKSLHPTVCNDRLT
jgi:hypothetical protein